jgi:anti-sigma B factor antagonist
MPPDEDRHLDFAVHSAPLAEGGTEVAVFGDLDLHSAPAVREELKHACEGEGPVVIDLRACAFVDSSGLAALAGAAVALDEMGRSLTIRGVGERVLRTFRLAGLAQRPSITIEPEPAGRRA